MNAEERVTLDVFGLIQGLNLTEVFRIDVMDVGKEQGSVSQEKGRWQRRDEWWAGEESSADISHIWSPLAGSKLPDISLKLKPQQSHPQMAIAPITGMLRKRFWTDITCSLGLGTGLGYAYWYVGSPF